jgi:ketosteroid isomerase-like protein
VSEDSPAETGAGEPDFHALEHDWMRAVADRDISTLEGLLGGEFTLTTGRPGAPVRTRDEYLDITATRYAIEVFEFEWIEARRYGETAVVRSRYRQRGSMDGDDRTQAFLMTDVFARRDGRWVAVTRHVSPLAPSA